MADNVTTGTTGITVLADEVIEATLGTGAVQFVKIMDGTLDATNKLAISSAGAASVSVTSSTKVIGSVVQSTAWTVASSSSTAVIGAVMPSTNWTVNVGSISTSTAVIGAVMPSTQWTVTTTPSSQATVSVSSSTSIIGAVMPSTNFTVNVASITTSTATIGAVLPSSSWTVSISTSQLGALGQTTAANSAPVVQATDTSFAYSASGTFASSTTASTYAAGDVYATAKQFSLGATSGGRIMITSGTLEIDTSATEATAWKLRLYNVTPPSSYADNAAWDLGSGDRTSYLGSINFGTPTDEGSTLFSELDSVNKQIKLSGTSVFGYLTNVSSSTAITTADHIVTLHAVAV